MTTPLCNICNDGKSKSTRFHLDKVHDITLDEYDGVAIETNDTLVDELDEEMVTETNEETEDLYYSTRLYIDRKTGWKYNPQTDTPIPFPDTPSTSLLLAVKAGYIKKA